MVSSNIRRYTDQCLESIEYSKSVTDEVLFCMLPKNEATVDSKVVQSCYVSLSSHMFSVTSTVHWVHIAKHHQEV